MNMTEHEAHLRRLRVQATILLHALTEADDALAKLHALHDRLSETLSELELLQ